MALSASISAYQRTQESAQYSTQPKQGSKRNRQAFSECTHADLSALDQIAKRRFSEKPTQPKQSSREKKRAFSECAHADPSHVDQIAKRRFSEKPTQPKQSSREKKRAFSECAHADLSALDQIAKHRFSENCTHPSQEQKTLTFSVSQPIDIKPANNLSEFSQVEDAHSPSSIPLPKGPACSLEKEATLEHIKQIKISNLDLQALMSYGVDTTVTTLDISDLQVMAGQEDTFNSMFMLLNTNLPNAHSVIMRLHQHYLLQLSADLLYQVSTIYFVGDEPSEFSHTEHVASLKGLCERFPFRGFTFYINSHLVTFDSSATSQRDTPSTDASFRLEDLMFNMDLTPT